MFSLSILPSAQGDLESGYWFYEAQGDGLGTYFLDQQSGFSVDAGVCIQVTLVTLTQ